MGAGGRWRGCGSRVCGCEDGGTAATVRWRAQRRRRARGRAAPARHRKATPPAACRMENRRWHRLRLLQGLQASCAALGRDLHFCRAAWKLGAEVWVVDRKEDEGSTICDGPKASGKRLWAAGGRLLPLAAAACCANDPGPRGLRPAAQRHACDGVNRPRCSEPRSRAASCRLQRAAWRVPQRVRVRRAKKRRLHLSPHRTLLVTTGPAPLPPKDSEALPRDPYSTLGEQQAPGRAAAAKWSPMPPSRGA